MPRDGDKAVGAEWVGKTAMATGSAETFAADLLEATFQLPAVPSLWEQVSSPGFGRKGLCLTFSLKPNARK